MGFLQLPGLGQVHFHEYGTGTKPLLAFHGYGMTGRQFHVLGKSLLTRYHVYGFDHFFHGESRLDGWTDKQIRAGMPKQMMYSYLQEWFKIYGEQRISLMGYSLGAGLALTLVEEYAHLIDDIILMAPDGLATRTGFHILTNNVFGKPLFRLATKSTWLAPFLLKAVKAAGVIDESLYQIAYNEIDTPKKRLDTYYTLNLIKQLNPDIEKVAALINQYNIKSTLVFGTDDHLFPIAVAKNFITKVRNAEIHEVKMGHWLVTPALDEYLTGRK